MSTMTSIGDPFLLSSYALPSRLSFSSRDALSEALHVTHQAGSKLEGYATAAVQGNGVHVLDVRLFSI